MTLKIKGTLKSTKKDHSKDKASLKTCKTGWCRESVGMCQWVGKGVLGFLIRDVHPFQLVAVDCILSCL